MSLSAFFSHSFNRSSRVYAQLQKMRRSVTVCKISFLPVVLELSPGVFNNSVLAVSGDSPGSQCEADREDTYSFSQSEWGRRRMCISETRWSPFVLPFSTTVPCFCWFYSTVHIVTVFPSIWHLKCGCLVTFQKGKIVTKICIYQQCFNFMLFFLLHQALMSITWTSLHATPVS